MLSLCTYRGIEQFIGRFPEHVNMIKMDDGHSVLHIAAANDHLDIVSLLSSMVGRRLKTARKLTMSKDYSGVS